MPSEGDIVYISHFDFVKTKWTVKATLMSESEILKWTGTKQSMLDSPVLLNQPRPNYVNIDADTQDSSSKDNKRTVIAPNFILQSLD